MIPSNWHRAEFMVSKTASHTQVAALPEDNDGGRYRIRTYDFHRVNESVYWK